MSRTPEGTEKDKVKAFLDSIRAYHYWPVPAGYGRQAVDCFACVRGHFWAVEVKKTANEEPTARQDQTLNKVAEAGGYSICGNAAAIIGCLHDFLNLKGTEH